MKRTVIFLIAICLLALTRAGAQSNLSSDDIRYQKDRFAGLHFDFHARKEDTTIGNTFTASMVDSLLTIVKPDFIQVDCKGHPGYSSYPTKVGNAPAVFRKDIMKIWRAETAKKNVPLFVHYSGVWDYRALELHPEWNRLSADGSSDHHAVSLLSPYESQLMIPQLKELATVYGVDGAWVDGDCWTLAPDYSPAVIAAFTKETGITEIPKKSTDPYYFEFNEFNRKLFRNYVRTYVNAIHAADPRFRITSNWSFSSMMPEKVDVPVDFLSGDVSGTNSVYSSAFESRCMALQGKPWDLMSWGFVWEKDLMSIKPAVQLEQEGAEVLAMGGGFQTYWQQNRDGSLSPYLFNRMAEIIRFCKERKEYSYKGEIVPQVGLLYSTYNWKRMPSSGLYSAHFFDAMKGALNILLDGQLPVEVLMDHQLPGRLEKYPLIVLPEWDNIDPAIHQQLLDYVRNGGQLLVIGAQAAATFAPQLGIGTPAAVQQDTAFFAGLGEDVQHLTVDFLPVRLENPAEAIGLQLGANDWRYKSIYPLASIHPLGKGKIAAIYLDLGKPYSQHADVLLPRLVNGIIKQMQPALTSEVSGALRLHQVVSRKNGKLYVHLINVSGAHDNPATMVYPGVDPLCGVQVKVHTAKKPKSILLQPGNRKLDFTYSAGVATIGVPRVNVYDIIELDAN